MRDYRSLFPYLKPHLGLLGLAAACMLGSSLLKGVSIGMLVPLVDLVLLNRTGPLPAWLPGPLSRLAERFIALAPLPKLHAVVALVVLLFILKNLVLFAQTVLMNDTALRFLRDMREALYRQYHRLSLNFFTNERTGELVSRVTYDVSVLQNAVTEGLADLIYQTSQAVVFTAVLFTIDWRLSLVALVLVPAIGYPIVRIGKMLRKLGFIVQERMADISSRLIETIQGIRIIRAFTAEAAEEARFGSVNQQYYKANIRTVKRREALAGITELIGVVGGLFVLELGGRAVLAGELSPGTFAFFLGALLSLVQPLKKLGRLHSIHQQALTAARRVVDILQADPMVKEKPAAPPAPQFRREIRFEEVWFSYLPSETSAKTQEDRDVLRGVNLAVRAGEVVAIVGPSGAGKTTLVHLALRFYDPSRGRVTLDGVDLRDVSLGSLRRQIGLVTQEPFLFYDTVRANIAFGQPDAPLEAVVRAAQSANADRFIRKLPKGYETPVGELGFKLSGGERQRVALARAIFKDPPILILDEATSQLDSESEALIQEALDRLMKDRTALVIAHRLSTIRRADRIVVLDQGRVTQVGRHEELLEGSDLYRRLYKLQMAP